MSVLQLQAYVREELLSNFLNTLLCLEARMFLLNQQWSFVSSFQSS